MTLTTERANPLRQWNPDWGGCSTARRPVAAVTTLFLRRSDFVKHYDRFTHEMTPREIGVGLRDQPVQGRPQRRLTTRIPGPVAEGAQVARSGLCDVARHGPLLAEARAITEQRHDCRRPQRGHRRRLGLALTTGDIQLARAPGIDIEVRQVVRTPTAAMNRSARARPAVRYRDTRFAGKSRIAESVGGFPATRGKHNSRLCLVAGPNGHVCWIGGIVSVCAGLSASRPTRRSATANRRSEGCATPSRASSSCCRRA